MGANEDSQTQIPDPLGDLLFSQNRHGIIIVMVDVHAGLGIIGGLLLTWSYLPYIFSTLKRQSRPHLYTWIIWTMTQVAATLAIIEGDGGLFSAIGIGAAALLSFLIMLLSIPYGTQNVTRFDTVALVVGVAAMLVWWKLDNPVLAILMISLIDGIGFLPTYRKTWHEPWSESLTAWTLFVAGNIFILFALEHYNLLTTVYIVTVTIASVLLILLSKHRRNFFNET